MAVLKQHILCLVKDNTPNVLSLTEHILCYFWENTFCVFNTTCPFHLFNRKSTQNVLNGKMEFVKGNEAYKLYKVL